MSEKDSGYSRRRLLQLGFLSSAGALAGCSNEKPSEEPPQDGTETNTPGSNETDSTDSELTEEKPTETDSSLPSIITVEATPTNQRGELRVYFKAEAEAGIARWTVSTPAGESSKSLDGTNTIEISERIESAPGAKETVTLRVTDQDGNTTEETTQAYARTQEVPTDTTLDLGATYQFPRQSCPTRQPTTGQYDELTPELINRHADELQGHGISRITVPVERSGQLDALSVFSETPLGENLTIQFSYDFLSWAERGTGLAEQLQRVREGIQSVSSYDSIDGRPVVLLQNVERIRFRDTSVLDDLFPSFDSLSEVVQTIRSELQLDGNDPFLIAETSYVTEGWVRPKKFESGQLQPFLRRFDAVQNELGKPRHVQRQKQADQTVGDAWLERTTKQLRVLRLFADREGLEFIPRIAPGFSNSTLGCPPETRIERDSEQFQSLLRYAAAYGTTARTTIESFNDWRLGSQIESGTMAGSDYGTAYLEAAGSAARNDPLFSQNDRSVYHVASDGSDFGTGEEMSPLASIQEALTRAGPDATVQVHSGTYQEYVSTVRDGEPDAPITITGPEDAVLQPYGGADAALWIKNSHIELTGLTIDGLLDPANPDDVSSYSDGVLLRTRPPDSRDTYLEDIVCAPDGIGNSTRSMILVQRTKHLEIGPLQVTGLAGAEYTVGDKTAHVGEIIYLGQPPRVIEGREDPVYNWDLYPWQGELDQSRHVHIHHIDNSEGHPHSQLVNTKTGTYDVLVEYCTDGGGSYNTEPYNKCATVRFQSYDATLRWCEITGADEHAIQIGNPQREWLAEHDYSIPAEQSGTEHSIYGNKLTEFGEKGLQIDTTADEQTTLCGNEIDGPADGDLDKSCSREVAEGDGIGHLGGDSPWQ